MLTGTGNGEPINIYLKPQSGAWQLANTVSGYANNSWTQSITLPGKDSLYFLAAAQAVPNPNSGQYTMEPSYVFSQAAANILRVIDKSIIQAHTTDFQDIVCGTADTSEVTIRNTGGLSLTIDSVQITQNNEGFSVISQLAYPIILAPGQDTEILVRLAPASFGQKTAVLTIYSNASNDSVLSMNLSGERDIINVRTTSVNFGNLQAAQFPATDTVSIANYGTLPITITAASFTNPFPFFVISTLPITGRSGGHGNSARTVSDPGVDSSYVGTLILADTPHCAPLTAAVSGSRETLPPVIASSQLQVLDTLLCDYQEFDTVVVHNVGTGALNIIQSSFTNGGSAYTLIAPAIPTIIAHGDSTMFIIAFTPDSAGPWPNTLNLINNDTIAGHNPWKIVFTGWKDSVGFFIPNESPQTSNLGILCIGSKTVIGTTILKYRNGKYFYRRIFSTACCPFANTIASRYYSDRYADRHAEYSHNLYP